MQTNKVSIKKVSKIFFLIVMSIEYFIYINDLIQNLNVSWSLYRF